MAKERVLQLTGFGKKSSKKDIPPGKTKKRFAIIPFILTFVILGIFWLIFSGKFDLFHISLGIISCFIVSAVSHGMLFPENITVGLMGCWLRFAAYLPWLFYQIFLANIHVLFLTFHPRMLDLINPKIINFDSRLKSHISRTIFANSITLTPGTITVHAGVMGEFAVHCIDDNSAQSLPGDMEHKIAKIFNE